MDCSKCVHGVEVAPESVYPCSHPDKDDGCPVEKIKREGKFKLLEKGIEDGTITLFDAMIAIYGLYEMFASLDSKIESVNETAKLARRMAMNTINET